MTTITSVRVDANTPGGRIHILRFITPDKIDQLLTDGFDLSKKMGNLSTTATAIHIDVGTADGRSRVVDFWGKEKVDDVLTSKLGPRIREIAQQPGELRAPPRSKKSR